MVPPVGEAGLGADLEFVRHLFAYSEANRRIPAGARVLEIGCGEGYGANVLADGDRIVVATDLSLQALRHLGATYPRVRARCQAAGTQLPFEHDSFDAVVSFQVLEHLRAPVAYLEEIRRVLKAGGRLLLTTPNRKLRLLPLQKPWNPYHVREYRGRELHRLLGRVFRTREVLGIMAQPAVMRAETARVRQRPSVVYGDAIERVLRGVWPRWLLCGAFWRRIRAVTRRPGRRPPGVEARTVAGLDAFFLSSDRDASLDLFAEAWKE